MIDSNVLEAARDFGLDTKSEFQKSSNGLNSNVFFVTNGSGRSVLKFYRSDSNSPTRLEREVIALNLFYSNGISNVPRLLDHSVELNCSLLSFVPGDNISVFEPRYIGQFQSFYKNLLSISNSLERGGFDVPAIDSCPDVSIIKGQVSKRLQNLIKEDNTDIKELLDEIRTIFQALSEKVGNMHSFNELRSILSTVDFGINNALINNNELFFIDFEFFGWDNPVHLISDTISHPANGLSIEQQIILLDRLLECYSPAEKEKIQAGFINANLLFDIKWCLIMLNPFLSSYYSNGNGNEVLERQTAQKNKVINKVSLIKQKMQNAKFSN